MKKTEKLKMVMLGLIPVILHSVAAAPPDCLESNVNSCMKVFMKDLESGVSVLESANDTDIAQICWRYRVSSDCITPFMYFCSSIKKRLHRQLEEFEFACTNDRSAAGSWPYMPTVGPKSGSSDEVNEALAADEQRRLVENAAKASIAAGVTILLIFMCFMADCITRCKVWMRVKKMTNAAAEQQAIKDAEMAEEEEEAQEDGTKKV